MVVDHDDYGVDNDDADNKNSGNNNHNNKHHSGDDDVDNDDNNDADNDDEGENDVTVPVLRVFFDGLRRGRTQRQKWPIHNIDCNLKELSFDFSSSNGNVCGRRTVLLIYLSLVLC